MVSLGEGNTPLVWAEAFGRRVAFKVAEADILPGRDELAYRGFYVETTSAVVWDALAQTMSMNGFKTVLEPVAVVLTGTGLKTT